MKDEVKYFKDQGFKVVGELGKKWWWRDPTRVSRDLISVEKTEEQTEQLIEAAAAILRNILAADEQDSRLLASRKSHTAAEIGAARSRSKVFQAYDNQQRRPHRQASRTDESV